MSRTLIVASAVCAMSAAAFLTPVQASPVSAWRPATAARPVHDRQGRLAPLRTLELICRDRWGFGWRYRRCMRTRLLMRTGPERPVAPELAV